ncbi:hypothetical protein LINGRAPRIM_LOCUS1176 [Linum grandiflorum]
MDFTSMMSTRRVGLIISCMWMMLSCFECITGQIVNLHKSSLFAVGEVPNLVELAEILGLSAFWWI